MIYSLSNCEWKVKGYYPWVPLKDRSMETGKELQGITPWIGASVPGGVHYDLYRAGLIAYPYSDMESLNCEWVEKRWWLYKTKISKKNIKGKYQFLNLNGIDYKAIIYVNGSERCRHEGMYETLKIDISREAALKEDLELKILIMDAPDEMGQIGKTSNTSTQKSRFNYKWDFSTRLVNLGIWEECFISFEEDARLEQPHISTDYQKGKGYVVFKANITENEPAQGGYEAEVTLKKNEMCLIQRMPVLANQISGCFEVEEPKLWYPNGYGEQELYSIKVELKRKGNSMDFYESEIGIRSIGYQHNAESPEGALPYTFCINDTALYIRGVNMTPLDHIYGNVSDQHYEHLVKAMKTMNVNMVRVWGGGVIEKEMFYQLCDKYGILVWQEFIQSSSGIDNVPSKRPKFMNLLLKTAQSALKRCRNHTSLSVWSGGNELTDENGVPADYEDETIAMLKEQAETLDPQRLFLPTSASGPNEFINREQGRSHDIHGNWNYMGNPEHYELYAQSDSLFHSEFGTEGMCSTRSMDKFLSKQYQTLQPAVENMVYRHHGEWWCTFNRDRDIFGERKNMEQMTKCSQWMQAEGLRFILEANRRRKFHNSGSIIWQINEPWPNVFCTSLMDYYLEPKMAYYWSQNAFADFAVSLDYRKLDYQPGELFQGKIYVGKERQEANMDYTITGEVLDMTGTVIFQNESRGRADCAKTVKAMELTFSLPDTQEWMFAVRLKGVMNGILAENIYFFGIGKELVYASALELEKTELTMEKAEEKDGEVKIMIQNVGKAPALHIYPYCETSHDLLCDRSHFTLFPNETATLRIQYSPKFESGFLNYQVRETQEAPEIKLDYFNQ